MPTALEPKLAKEEFHARYDDEKPYFEFWDGEAVQKTGGTWLHSVTQGAMLRLLDNIGFDSLPEVTLHLDPSYELIPDVIALEGILRGDYPTEPFEVVIEVLMPQDPFTRLMRKCWLYERWGIRQIVIVDPQDRQVWRFTDGSPRESDIIATRGEAKIPAQALWDEVDLQYKL
jgi:Uma2 family endonuclease